MTELRRLYRLPLLCRKLAVVAVAHCALAIVSCASSAFAAETPASQPPHGRDDAVVRIFQKVVVSAVPHQFNEADDWGKTKWVTRGLKIDHDGLKLRVHRRKKEVRHGMWKRYELTLVEPQDQLQISASEICLVENGRVAFTLTVSAQLRGKAQAVLYQGGIHVGGLSGVVTTGLELELGCTIGLHLTSEGWTPQATLDPKVTSADLRLPGFRLRRVGHADGPLVNELGDELRKAIRRKLREPELVAKLNRAIEKNRDQMTLNAADLLKSPWARLWTSIEPPKKAPEDAAIDKKSERSRTPLNRN